nr:MAG TPA: TRAF PROTEIN, TRAO PROTEIN, TRAN ADHESION, BACTERIAL SECRETION.5A [Caudoviricetes sp.]
MKKSIILLPFILSACIIVKAPQQETEEEITQSNTFQLNEDTGILCKDNHSIACNEIRDYCFNNTADKDCYDFYQVAGKDHG